RAPHRRGGSSLNVARRQRSVRTPAFPTTLLALLAIVAALALAPTLGTLADNASAAQDASPAADGSATTADDSSSATGKTTVQVGWTQNLDSLNPFVGYQNVSYQVYYLNFDTLVNYDPATLEPIPGLAERWEISEDGRVWTFFIRKDAVWQDGEPLTAHDVAFTYTYVIDNELSAFTNYTTSIETVTATDDYTVRFECSQPRATMLQMWVPIIPEHIWSSIDPEEAQSTYPNDPPVIGSGPFQVVEWKRNRYVRMVANKDYWDGAPHIDEIMFRIYTSNETLAADLLTGVLDMSNYIDAAQFKRFQDEPGWTAHAAVGAYFDELGFNCYDGPSKGHPILRDPQFRTAVSWAIDREAVARIAFNGRAAPATGMLPARYYSAELDYHYEPPAAEKQTYDPARAKELLDEAGFRDTDGDGVREYKGKPIELRLWALQEKVAYATAGKLITGWLEDVGLRIDFQTLDDGTVSDHMYAYEGDVFTPDFDLFIWGWGGDFDPGFLLSVFRGDQIENWSDCNWSNPAYDSLYVEQEACLDPQRRKELIWRMQELIYEENPYVVLVYPESLQVYDSAGWEGWTRQPAKTGGVANNWTFLRLKPKAVAVESGSDTGLIVGIVVAAVVVVGGVAAYLVWRRRGRPSEADS
ncbi:MAG: ABC transporter substrate-binding protein, partial [Actinobacteria bacterium]|nr:ABC transporter substrate-binding protein [Actinomycetota bacterium]